MDRDQNSRPGREGESGSNGSKHRVAVVGCGNVGRFSAQAVLASNDMELAGIVRRQRSLASPLPPELAGVPVASSVEELGVVEAAILAVPTRQVPGFAEEILRRGTNTVDSYDIHGELVEVKNRLHAIAKESGSVAIVSAGWDPGTDSVLRALLEAMAPQGITYTNFGPGVSMGHTTAVKALPGVRDALSITLPIGAGLHMRQVFVQLEEGADFDDIKQAVLDDPYFRKDKTTVVQIDDVQNIEDLGHGVAIERRGVSGFTHNQRFRFEMRMHNPALTGQILAAAARASFKQMPGAYTLLEVPAIDLLHGDRDSILRKLT